LAKKVKKRQRRYIEKGMSINNSDDDSKKKVKKRIKKPKMPARIKKTPTSKRK